MIGKHWCFELGEWEKGLVYLAQGTDDRFMEVANYELNDPTSSADQIRIGDLWWELADAANEYRRPQLRRAAYWYGRGVNGTIGLDRERVRKRIQTAT